MIQVFEAIEKRIKPKYPRKFRKLLDSTAYTISSEDQEFLWNAYTFARRAHKGQLRLSGEPYFEHCYQTALNLAKMNMDKVTLAGGLLHDVLEDAEVTIEDITEEFGDEVSLLVKGVTKISELDYKSSEEKQAGNFRKLLFSVIEDIRVILIKFADRLHNMNTLEYLPESKAKRIALETRDIYAPLAHRLGMGKVKWELEDLALKALDPEAYKSIDKKVKDRRGERERYIQKVAKPLKIKLKQENIRAEISCRPNHFYSIHGKMARRQKPFEEIYDLFAIRIIVDSVSECYATLGFVHSMHKPVAERFKDFIAIPKANGYQSIHTTIVGPGGRMVEVQIRTHEMDRTAEDGIAAHWRYKEGKGEEEDLDQYMKWLRDLIETLQSDDSDPSEFLTSLKIDLFKDEIFAFTPKGELIQLPIGSTPVDFAYAVHTEVGNHCIGAKVSGKMVPLNTQLSSGDSVEILTSDSQTPNPSHLKFVKTGKARSRIKRWEKMERREQSVKLGREIIQKQFKRKKIPKINKKLGQVLESTKFTSLEELYSAVGLGNFAIEKLLNIILPPEIKEKQKTEEKGKKSFFDLARRRVKGVRVQGIDNIMINFGKCCQPIPGDEIVGFITKGKGVIIHRVDCKDSAHLFSSQERTIEVEWDTGKKDEFLVRLQIQARERKHFLRDLTESISTTNTNILSLDLEVMDEIASVKLLVQVKDLKHFNNVRKKIGDISGIIGVERG